MQVTGTFPEGIITADGRILRDFTLQEQTFRTRLEIAFDPAIDADLLADPVYDAACLMAKRLQVDGIDKVTPEQVLDLGVQDSSELINKVTLLETQRANFRSAAQAAAEEGAGTSKAGSEPPRD